jgi:hypothetical protein
MSNTPPIIASRATAFREWDDAPAMGVSRATAFREWDDARSWLPMALRSDR